MGMPGAKIVSAPCLFPSILFQLPLPVAPRPFFRPPAFSHMSLTLFFGQLFDLVSRIPQNTEEDTAAGIFPISVALVRDFRHALYQIKSLANSVVTLPHCVLRFHSKVDVLVMPFVQLPSSHVSCPQLFA